MRKKLWLSHMVIWVMLGIVAFFKSTDAAMIGCFIMADLQYLKSCKP